MVLATLIVLDTPVVSATSMVQGSPLILLHYWSWSRHSFGYATGSCFATGHSSPVLGTPVFCTPLVLATPLGNTSGLGSWLRQWFLIHYLSWIHQRFCPGFVTSFVALLSWPLHCLGYGTGSCAATGPRSITGPEYTPVILVTALVLVTPLVYMFTFAGPR